MSDELDQLFNQVLFESDRTCCVCRDSSRPVQVHHVDGDHSNNERGNLAVLCKICHDRAHTTTPFSRNLNQDQVQLYDTSWRRICVPRLLPEAESTEYGEYRREVMLEVSLTCHSWKNDYMAMYPGHFQNVQSEFHDVWEMMIESTEHSDSTEEWNQYRPLFKESINYVIGELRSILSCHSEVVPISIKTSMIRTIRRLSTEKVAYLSFGPRFIKVRFQEVLRALATLDRSADAVTSASSDAPVQE